MKICNIILILIFFVVGCSNSHVVENLEYKHIDMFDDTISTKATRYESTVICCFEEMVAGFSGPYSLKCDFVGPAKISITTTGKGVFTVTGFADGESINVKAGGNTGGVILKKGVGNQVTWSLSIQYFANPTDGGTITIVGHIEEEAPQQDGSAAGQFVLMNWYNNLPPYIRTERISNESVKVSINSDSKFTMIIYRKDRKTKEYFEYEVWKNLTRKDYYFYFDESYAYCYVFYRESTIGSMKTLEYVGDIEIHPSFWNGNPYF